MHFKLLRLAKFLFLIGIFSSLLFIHLACKTRSSIHEEVSSENNKKSTNLTKIPKDLNGLGLITFNSATGYQIFVENNVIVRVIDPNEKDVTIKTQEVTHASHEGLLASFTTNSGTTIQTEIEIDPETRNGQIRYSRQKDFVSFPGNNNIGIQQIDHELTNGKPSYTTFNSDGVYKVFSYNEDSTWRHVMSFDESGMRIFNLPELHNIRANQYGDISIGDKVFIRFTKEVGDDGRDATVRITFPKRGSPEEKLTITQGLRKGKVIGKVPSFQNIQPNDSFHIPFIPSESAGERPLGEVLFQKKRLPLRIP